MSFADGDLLDGWHLPAATNLPGAALLGDPFGGLEEGLALAAGSAPDTDISAGIHSFFDGSPWFEGGAHGGGAPPDLQRAPGQQPAGFLGSEEFPLRAASDATQVVWRCLGGCAQPCSRCVPPPPQEEVGNYQLVGERGAKNGEKLLRHGLVRCPEWSNVSMRSETAAKALAAGDSVLHDLLVEHNSAKLRKPQLIHLCRLWRYSSHVWKRRGVPRNANAETSAMPGEAHATRSRQLARVAEAAPRAPSNQLMTGTALAESMRLALQSAVWPHVQHSLPHLRGVQAQRNAALISGTIDLVGRYPDTQAAVEMFGRIRLSVRAKRLALREWARSAQADGGTAVSVTYAYYQLAGDDGIAETMLRLLTTVWGAGLRDSRRNEAQLMQAQSDLHPAVSRWFGENQQGFRNQLEWLASAQALLAPFKCGDLTSYAIASDSILEAVEDVCHEIKTAFTSRLAWLRAFLREHARQDASGDLVIHHMPDATNAVRRLLDACAEEPS